MKAFVTGASGFLGSHLVDRLIEKKCEVHVLVRKSSDLTWLLGKKVHYHYGDIVGDGKGLREGLKGAEVCYHLAGVITAVRSATYYEVNAQGTSNLLEACLKVNPQIRRVVVVTSIAAHGPSPGDAPATEEDECRPVTDYGFSKRDAELITFRYVDRLAVTIVRPPAIYGPRDRQFLKFFRLAQKGFLLLPGWGRQLLNIAYVDDVVNGILLAAESEKAVGQVFFIGGGENYESEQVADIIGQSMKKTVSRIRVPVPLLLGIASLFDAVGRLLGWVPPINLAHAKNFVQRNWGIDISKAKRVLGFKPAFDLKRGVAETVDWYREEGWLK